jgi:AcrR family transcriptional regulator
MATVARPRDQAIDQAVLTACAQLLGEVGRARLTREQIAVRAGVSLPAVTRRYRDVDAVVRAVAATQPTRPALPVATSLREHLVAVLARTAAGFADPANRRAAAELLAASAGDPAIAAAFTASLQESRAETVAWVGRAVADGDLPAGTDPELVLDLLGGALWYRHLWRQQLTTPADVEQLVDLVLAGAAHSRPGGEMARG